MASSTIRGGALALILLTACTPATPETQRASPPKISASQMNAEYAQATARLTLPPGAAWRETWPIPPEATDPSGHDRPGFYSPGDGRRFAEAWWFCSWQGEWLSQHRHDATRTRAAMETLRGVTTTTLYTSTHDTGRRLILSVVRAAESGNGAPIETDIRLNCSGPGWPTSPPPWTADEI